MQDFGYTEDAVCQIKGKEALMATLEKEMGNGDDNFFSSIEKDSVVVNDEVIVKTTKAEEKTMGRPNIGEEGWEEYVMSFFRPEELEVKGRERYPKVNALRRVAQLLLGDIVDSGPTMVNCPTVSDAPGRATVLYEVKIRWKADIPPYINLEAFQEPIRVFREAADSWIGNTPDLYAVHPVATASSKAEGRAFRKALCLSTYAAEEMSNDKDASTFVEIAKSKIKKDVDPEWKGEERIGENVMEVIRNLCDRLDIDLEKMLEQQLPHVVSLEKATKQDGSNIMALLNKYKTKGSDSLVIPDTIKKGIE